MNYLIDIRKPLIDAFIAVVGTTYEIEYENAGFEAPADDNYLSVYFVTNDTTAASLGDNGLNETDGFLQIDLNWQPETGEYDQSVLIAQLATAFKIGRAFVSNDVTTKIRSFRSVPGRKVNNYWRMSASIIWYSFSNRN